MELHHNERTQVRRPVDPPVSLDDGRLEVGRAAMAGGFVLGSLTVASLGGWLVAVGSSTGAALVGFFGLGVSLVSLTIGGCVFYISIAEWLDRRRRVEDWHIATLEAWREQGGAETVEQVSEWSLSTENPGHVLLTALWVHMRVQQGAETPYSARQLRGPLLIAGRRAGELSKLGGEQMGRRFAELGLIAGRAEGRAGEWVPETADQVIELVTDRWGVGHSLRSQIR